MKRFDAKKLLILVATLVLIPFHPMCAAQTDEEVVDVHFFFSSSCPHCAKESYFLSKLEMEHDNLQVHRYEVSTSQANTELLLRIGRETGADISGVPFTIVGNMAFSGFLDEETTGVRIERAALSCMESPCIDVVGMILGTTKPITPQAEPDDTPNGPMLPGVSDKETDEETSASNSATGGDEYLRQSVTEHQIPDAIPIPFFGEVRIKNISLPAITIVIGALDGFNPCAMWVLLFLISLLIGMEDKRRMWTLGSTFIATSAIIYFLFMTAWLNALLFLGFVSWVRVGIAILAVAAGGYHLRAYLRNPDSGCEVMNDTKRKQLFTHIREVVSRKGFVFAMVGIIGLAFAINLVELLCSAGLPVIYTQILTMTNLPVWQYYGYLGLYILVFMLDDLFVFIIAMKTLQMVGITTKYARTSHLVGGILMIIIGALLILKPSWLMFG
jgi:hypothetical protein